MLEATEKILASISAKKKMTREEIDNLPYLKTISEYGIEISLYLLEKLGYIRISEDMNTFKITSLGMKYIDRRGYLA